MIRAELLLDEILRRAEIAPLPVEFTSFQRASVFAELRGWSTGRVQMFRHDGIYRVVVTGTPCGCPDQKEVRPT